MSIHSTAVIDPSARLDSSVTVGPYAVIGAEVEIGAETNVEAHAVVSGPATIGERNLIGSFATVGGAPQDLLHDVKLVLGELGLPQVIHQDDGGVLPVGRLLEGLENLHHLGVLDLVRLGDLAEGVHDDQGRLFRFDDVL